MRFVGIGYLSELSLFHDPVRAKNQKIILTIQGPMPAIDRILFRRGIWKAIGDRPGRLLFDQWATRDCDSKSYFLEISKVGVKTQLANQLLGTDKVQCVSSEPPKGGL